MLSIQPNKVEDVQFGYVSHEVRCITTKMGAFDDLTQYLFGIEALKSQMLLVLSLTRIDERVEDCWSTSQFR